LPKSGKKERQPHLLNRFDVIRKDRKHKREATGESRKRDRSFSGHDPFFLFAILGDRLELLIANPDGQAASSLVPGGNYL